MNVTFGILMLIFLDAWIVIVSLLEVARELDA